MRQRGGVAQWRLDYILEPRLRRLWGGIAAAVVPRGERTCLKSWIAGSDLFTTVHITFRSVFLL